MLIDDLREQLKEIKPDADAIILCWEQSNKESAFQELTKLSLTENFWQHPGQKQILKELQAVKSLRERYQNTIKSYRDLLELVELFKEDETELKNLSPLVSQCQRNIRHLKIEFLLGEEEDASNCFVSINSGAGGTESQDWADMLLRMYLRFCEREGFTTNMLDYQAGEGAGIKSATIYVEGKNAFGLMKNEQGVHRLVRVSPFDANKRRHTSFAGVSVLPEVQTAEITINPLDLRIDTFRAGGAGGQHVNKTESAIRITHLPTGFVVQCQSERSQVQNKETALKMLKAKLIRKQKEDAKSKVDSIEKKSIEWGSQIRSYVLHPYKMVKDHRTELESPQPELVLDGDLMEFIEKNLIREAGQKSNR
ncbi:MAG: Peptide chain release factor 2 [candidate division TM6 bacterium GW2011_GWE2_42_60]|nr:MAG: Peptide chain release factor 2 [candidate division TM6 bacterium GW2011_GWE2_42_60]HBY05487.1 peptide chain release factor 2 [Candidatus Dependentiae bacterium]